MIYGNVNVVAVFEGGTQIINKSLFKDSRLGNCSTFIYNPRPLVRYPKDWNTLMFTGFIVQLNNPGKHKGCQSRFNSNNLSSIQDDYKIRRSRNKSSVESINLDN